MAPLIHRAQSLVAALMLGAAGCTPREIPHRPRVAGSDAGVVPVAAVAAAPGTAADPEGGCAPPRAPVTAPGWRLEGYHPGPPLVDVLAVGRRGHRVLVATTRARVCTSADDGAHWSAGVGAESRFEIPTLVALPALDTVAVVAQGTADEPSAPRVLVARDDGARWEALALPTAAGPRARVVTDRAGRIYVASATQVWTSQDARGFEGPRRLPGSEADGFDACGDTLVARAHAGSDGFWHHSEDHGSTWRPFRLGVLGLEGGGAVVRCLGWRGGVEAGRALLPGHWSFDQGRTWQQAQYDATARTLARTLTDDPRTEAEAPHCGSGPSGELVCMDAGRLVLPGTGEHGYEVHAPAGCEHVRLVDDGRMVAFGPGCGLFVSTDRGGLWRAAATSFDPLEVRAAGAGRGGFVGADVAWRVDGGVWWTRDGGAHWRLVPSPNARTLERGVFIDGSRGVFSRTDGWVVATRDGGRSWTFVLRGEVERVASAGPWVMVTTVDRVRVSADGGTTWRPSGTIPADRALDPSLESAGAQRRFAPAPGLRVTQQGDRILVGAHGSDTEVVRGLARGYDLLAAHATPAGVDRILMADGAVLQREPMVTAAARHRRTARR